VAPRNAIHCRNPQPGAAAGAGAALVSGDRLRDGRLTVGIPKRQANRSAEPKDDLDKLMDSLGALDV
jgi:hypothetical protein